MIVDALVHVVTAFIKAFLGILPRFTLPDWLTGTGPGSLSDYGAQIGAVMGKLDRWLPTPVLAAGIGLVLAACGFAIAVRVLRIILSLFTGGGGGAA